MSRWNFQTHPVTKKTQSMVPAKELEGQRGGFISGPPVPGEIYWWASQEATRAAGGAAVEPLVSEASQTMAQDPLTTILRREREK